MKHIGTLERFIFEQEVHHVAKLYNPSSWMEMQELGFPLPQ